MRKRTRSREYALQMLYEIEITHSSVEDGCAHFWQLYSGEEIEPDVKEFTEELVKGVLRHREQIDSKITSYSTNWQLHRMPLVDKNILRVSCYELIYRSDIPPKVSINEAVEIAKRYSGAEAGKFVNAILDKVKAEMHIGLSPRKTP
jgi:N utilization substance protein B